MELGQLFSRDTQAIFFNWKEKPVQVAVATVLARYFVQYFRLIDHFYIVCTAYAGL